jgi:anti-sigma regulatory factor (Ser/Thr protein kinase)
MLSHYPNVFLREIFSKDKPAIKKMDFCKALDFTKSIDITFCVTSHQKTIHMLKKETTSLLSSLPDRSTCKQLILVIDEMLQNAYEHGNLELLSEEKISHQQLNTLSDILLEKERKYGEREITLSISLSATEICIKVRNEGPGFDWEKVLEKSLHGSVQTRDISTTGNGIPLLLKISDELKFEDSGRVCIFKKNLLA